MKRISNLLAWMLPLVIAIVIGCGGSGARSNGTPPSSLTRVQVKEGFGRSLMALAQSGAFGVTSVGTSGSSGGGGGIMSGMPDVGGFLLSGGMGGGRTRTEPGTGGGGGGEPGGTSFYFDEYLGLWADLTYSDTGSTTLLYVDEAKTQPAGSFVSEFDLTFSNYTSTFEITAGNFSGAKGSYITVSGIDSGTTSWENTWPGWGTDKGTSEWSIQGGSWSSRNDAEDGSWYESSGSYTIDGIGTLSGADSRGFKYSFRYFADGSGEGRIAGPLPGLPCTIEWSVDGTTTITYADGTVEVIPPGGWYDDGSGTSGGGDGSEPGTTSSSG